MAAIVLQRPCMGTHPRDTVNHFCQHCHKAVSPSHCGSKSLTINGIFVWFCDDVCENAHLKNRKITPDHR